MKIRSLVLAPLALLVAHSAFAGTACTDRSTSPIPDGSGGFFTQFDCTFYWQNVYPFNLTPYIDQTVPSADYPENYLVPGYLVFSTSSTDVTNQTLTTPAAFQDILYFVPNVAAGTGSAEVILYWPTASGGPGFPTVSAITAGGFLVEPEVAGGIETYNPGDGNHTFTINQSSGVPEPSTLLMGLTASIGLLIARRRHSQRSRGNPPSIG